MYRKLTLVVFGVMVAASAIYALMDRKTVTTSSDKAYAAYLRGDEFTQKLYTQEAIAEFERAVQLDPQFAMAHARLAWLYFDTGRDDEYKQARDKALGLIDKVRELEKIRINLGFARSEKRPEDLEKYANELIEKYPNSLEAHIYRSGKYWGERNTDAAIEENLKILNIEPGYALAHNMLGYLYFEKGEFDKALESINRYAAMAVDQANPHDSYGEILSWLGRYDEALQQFQMADSIKPNLDFVMGHMGTVYFNKGMYRDALGALFKAREVAVGAGRKLEFELGIADCYLFSERYDDARRFLEENIVGNPDVPSLHLRLGLLYAWTGESDKALIELGIMKGISAKRTSQSQAAANSKDRLAIEIALMEGELAASKGNFKSAVESFESISSSIEFASRPFVNYRLGTIYLKWRKPEKAIEILTNGLKDNPNHPLTLITLATAFGTAGQNDAKAEVLRRLLTVYRDADEDFPHYMRALSEFEALQQHS